MSRQVLILKDVNYGASQSSATVNAVNNNPYVLGDGALGIFGKDPQSANNAHTLALITDGGSDAAGLVPAASFVGKQIQLAQGIAGKGADMSPIIDVAGITIESLAYTAPVKKVITVGYHPSLQTGGSLNLIATILKGDAAGIVVNDRADQDYATTIGKAYSGAAPVESATGYQILKDISDRVSGDPTSKVVMEIFSNGTITELTEDATFTNGSKNVTFAGNQTIATGAFITVQGALYKVAVGVTAGTSITLDREFQGSTVTIDVSATTDEVGTVASITEYGFTITDKNNFQNVEVALDGLIADATKSVTTALVWGTGTATQVATQEENKRPTFGQLDNIDRRVPLRDLEVDLTATYDLYVLRAVNSRYTSDPHAGSRSDVKDIELYLAFPSGVADTAGKNQSNFEDIMTSLGVTINSLW